MAREARAQGPFPIRDPERPVTEVIRDWIVGGLHLGHLSGGDRLPSVREMSTRLGADHRAVAQVYRVLEGEGLVEMHARRGAFLRRREGTGSEQLEEKARWLTGVLVEARRRRIGVPTLPEFVRGWTAGRTLRCLCIESNLDLRSTLCAELGEDFGLHTTPVTSDEVGAAVAERGRALRDEEPFGRADALVTTAFHERQVRRLATLLGKPAIVVTLDEEAVKAVEHHLEREELVLLCEDPEFGRRLRATLRAAGRDAARLRVVLAADEREVAKIDRSAPVLATRAAVARLDPAEWKLLVPRFPTISHHSAGEIAELLVRHNMEAMRGAQPAPP